MRKKYAAQKMKSNYIEMKEKIKEKKKRMRNGEVVNDEELGLVDLVGIQKKNKNFYEELIDG